MTTIEVCHWASASSHSGQGSYVEVPNVVESSFDKSIVGCLSGSSSVAWEEERDYLAHSVDLVGWSLVVGTLSEVWLFDLLGMDERVSGLWFWTVADMLRMFLLLVVPVWCVLNMSVESTSSYLYHSQPTPPHRGMKPTHASSCDEDHDGQTQGRVTRSNCSQVSYWCTIALCSSETDALLSCMTLDVSRCWLCQKVRHYFRQ